MITEAKSRQVAIESVYIGMGLLFLLDDVTGKDYSRQSIHRQDLDRIAQQLGFPDAQAIWEKVEYEREYQEDYGWDREW